MAEAFFHTDPGNNSSSSSPNFILVNPGNQISSVKLTDDNYLLWHLQVLSVIRGLGLEIFMLENPPIHLRMLNTEATVEIVNPNYVSWCHQDRLFSFLLASMTEGIQSQMIGCDTFSQIWLRVSRLFASRSEARVMQYKLQLQTLKKGTMNMREYLNKMKGYIDIIASCGHTISEDDQILHILGGVGLESDSVVVHVTSRVDTLSVAEVGALLLAHEGRIESFHTVSGLDSIPHAVNATTFSSYKKNDNSYSHSDSDRIG